MFVGVTGTNARSSMWTSVNLVSTSDFFFFICLFFQNRLDECQYKTIICFECKEQVLLINLEKHKNEECEVSQNFFYFEKSKVSFIFQ